MLRARIQTAIVLIALIAIPLFFVRGLPFAVIALVLPTFAAWEWAGLFGCTRQVRWMYTFWMFIIGLLLSLVGDLAWLWGSLFAFAVLFWLVIAPLWLHFQWRLVSRPVALVLGALLLLTAWKGVVVWHESNALNASTAHAGWQLLALMAVVWIADSAAYFAGKQFGRHKLAPSISPGKTWEGAVGGLVAVTLYIGWLALRNEVPHGYSTNPSIYFLLFIIAVLLTAVSIVGDLLESLFKRQAGVKDSGTLLPGHGGVLDRVDSLIAVMAVAGAARWLFNQ